MRRYVEGLQSALRAGATQLRKLLVSRGARVEAMENISLLMSAGVDAATALDSVRASSRSPALANVVAAMQKDVYAGLPLWQTMERHNFLEPQYIWLLRIGEERGTLVENQAAIVKQQRKERQFMSRLRAALAYPLIVATVAIVAGLTISWFILPRLAQTFSQLDVPLPLLTRALISFGSFLSGYGALAVPLALVGFAAAMYLLFFAPRTKRIGQSLLMRTPGVGPIVQHGQLARFGFIFGSLQDVGVPITDVLASLAASEQVWDYRRLWLHLSKRIEAGETFESSLNSFSGVERLMPAPVRQMLISAEQAGRLAIAGQRIGAAYEEKIEVESKNLATTLEPLLLFVVWLGVVLLAIAIISPVYNILGGIK